MTPNLGGDSNEEFEKRFWTNNETISISLFGLHRGELFHNVGWDSLWRQRHLRRALHLRDGLRHRGDIQHDHKSERRQRPRRQSRRRYSVLYIQIGRASCRERV